MFIAFAMSHLASQPETIIAASYAYMVQNLCLELFGLTSRLHYSGKLRLQGLEPLP